MRRFVVFVLIATLAAAPALVVRASGFRLPPLAAAGLFGLAILAAGFMLNWGAETAERRISQRLVVALVALITVLPEYAVDVYYAFQAGRHPSSNYVHYAAANMTGANRLLIGFGWPLVVILHWWRTRERAVALPPKGGTDVAFLAAASFYAFVLLVKDRIDLIDFVLLLSLFGAYIWLAGRESNGDDHEDQREDPGPAGALVALPAAAQWVWTGALTLMAGLVIFASAEPFAESIVAAGRVLRIDEYVLIQWVAPLATEAPTITLVVIFVLASRATRGLATMLSDKFNQWTLLVGMLPLASSVGAARFNALPLDARQHEEVFLTAGQSLFAVSLLLTLRLGLGSAIILAVLFFAQVFVAFVFREDTRSAVAWLTAFGWGYLALAIPLLVLRGAPLLGSVGRQLTAKARRDRPLVRTQSASH